MKETEIEKVLTLSKRRELLQDILQRIHDGELSLILAKQRRDHNWDILYENQVVDGIDETMDNAMNYLICDLQDEVKEINFELERL